MNTDRLMPRAISFAMAALLTWSTFAVIDTLATHQHAANDLMARNPPSTPARG